MQTPLAKCHPQNTYPYCSTGLSILVLKIANCLGLICLWNLMITGSADRAATHFCKPVRRTIKNLSTTTTAPVFREKLYDMKQLLAAVIYASVMY